MRSGSFGALALIAALVGAPVFAATEYLGSYVWRPSVPLAGGYSALWLDGAGRGFVTLSDRGHWVRGQLLRDADGRIVDVQTDGAGPLLRSTGEPLRGLEQDAEALAFADGALFVAFEGVHRIMRHADIAAPPERIPQAPSFPGLQRNSGLEALAADARGWLYAIPERSGQLQRPFPVYRFDGETWTKPFGLRRAGRFLVAGADIGPDGRLYLLERDFAIFGFRTRVRSFDLTGADERLEMETAIGVHDNLEGISVWQDAAGRLHLTMISDDNRQPLVQQTEFVEYLLDVPLN